MAIVVSTFNREITELLLAGAQECLVEHGASKRDIGVFRCPGAFELPQAANEIASQGGWDAIVCLGAVIRGETPHFDYIADQAAVGIQEMALKHRLPIVFGVLTTNTVEQAAARAGGPRGNKGWDAAITALEMMSLFKIIRSVRRPVKKR